ncbi:MAG: hypothetical protein IJ055_03125 [Oscillospiraceae bacterium]|nr:hypothetical protein [Oscillospiraceae bacterium]
MLSTAAEKENLTTQDITAIAADIRSHSDNIEDDEFSNVMFKMQHLGLWKGEPRQVREPIVSLNREVGFVNSDAAGIFVPCAKFGDHQ